MPPPSTNDKQSLETLAVTAKRDRRARAELVDACLLRIDAMARNRCDTERPEYDGVMQAGVAGLLRALERYDATLGTPFWYYAAWWVRQAMQQFADDCATSQAGCAPHRRDAS
jgi:DNA-directed RNA polymerase specialized sigma subunit